MAFGDAVSFLLYPFAASVAFVLIHAYLGVHVLRRNIVFADLALAQLSALGVTVAFALGYPPVSLAGFAYAFASIVLITYMSTLASVEHAASQFGLLTSLCAFPGSILAGFSGFVIEHTGFVWFFIWTSLIGIPVAGILAPPIE